VPGSFENVSTPSKSSNDEDSMTNRHSAYLVILEHDMREDDAQATVTALGQIKGVLSVGPYVAENLAIDIAESRVRNELSQKLFEVLYPKRTI
jgi:hypothetical protein